MKNCFVIVNYNDSNSVIDLINNIKHYKVIEEIVVVDNNSTDDSVKLLNRLRIDNLKIISTDHNGGYSYALNIGCKYLINKYSICNIFVSNADVVINQEDDLLSLSKYLVGDNVIVAPWINTNGVIGRGWRIPSVMKEIVFNLPLIQKIIIKSYNYENTSYIGDATEVDTVSGCFFLISSDHLKAMNYFDDNVFLYYEENIFGVKTSNLKKKIIVVNNVEVIHNHSVSIDKSINRLNKVKEQKISQYYFQKEYNKASCISLLLLKVTANIALLMLKIKYSLKRP